MLQFLVLKSFLLLRRRTQRLENVDVEDVKI